MPNTAFLAIIVGVLLLYCECIWIGKIVFGLAGSLLFLAGLSMFARLPHTMLGLWLLVASGLLFALAALLPAYQMAGIAAVVALSCGFWRLCPPPFALEPLLVLPVCAGFGAVTLTLLSIAQRARSNKRRFI